MACQTSIWTTSRLWLAPVAVGGVYHINKKMDLNVAYFHTFYDHMKTSESVALNAQTSINYSSDYTRNNNVFSVGLDICF